MLTALRFTWLDAAKEESIEVWTARISVALEAVRANPNGLCKSTCFVVAIASVWRRHSGELNEECRALRYKFI